MFKQSDHEIDTKWMVASFLKFTAKCELENA